MTDFTFKNSERAKLKDCSQSGQNLIINSVGTGLLEWAHGECDGTFIEWMRCNNDQLSPNATYRVLAKPYTLDDALRDVELAINTDVSHPKKFDENATSHYIEFNEAKSIIKKLAESLGGEG